MIEETQSDPDSSIKIYLSTSSTFPMMYSKKGEYFHSKNCTIKNMWFQSTKEIW